MSGSNYRFLTCIQVSQDTGKVIWYSHCFKNFLQFIVIHTVKGHYSALKRNVPSSLEKTRVMMTCLCRFISYNKWTIRWGCWWQEACMWWQEVCGNQCVHAWVLHCFSRVWLCATPWTVAHQAPLSMVFSRQEYWNGLPFLSPGDQPRPLAFQADSLPSEPPGKFKKSWDHCFHQHGNKV